MSLVKEKKSLLIIVILLLTLAITSFLVRKEVKADLSISVNTTTKISVCGNGIVEGGEDCEGDDLNGQTCEGLGYGSGTLSCDIACSFDTYQCSPAPTPTSTPTPTPTPTPTSTPTPTPTTSTSSTTTTTSTTTPTSTPVPTQSPAAALKSALLPTLEIFDLGGIGKIRLIDLAEVVSIWVDEWKNVLIEELAQSKGEEIVEKRTKKCDINGDKRCNLRDFSILMAYIGR